MYIHTYTQTLFVYVYHTNTYMCTYISSSGVSCASCGVTSSDFAPSKELPLKVEKRAKGKKV